MTISAQTPEPLDKLLWTYSIGLMLSQPWLQRKQDEYIELINGCPAASHREMLIDLLRRTNYISSSEFHAAIDQLRSQVEETWKLDPGSTWFVSSNNKDSTDSSQEILNLLKSSHWKGLGWHRQQFLIQYKAAAVKAKAGDTIVMVDDFVGSGATVIKSLGWFAAESAKTGLPWHLKVLAVAGCAAGLEAISAAGFDIYATRTVEKGLSDHLSGPALLAAVSDMTDLEDALAQQANSSKFSKYRFGWGQQEAVYVREGGNTPNNVFPVFWWNQLGGRVRPTIMHRT